MKIMIWNLIIIHLLYIKPAWLSPHMIFIDPWLMMNSICTYTLHCGHSYDFCVVWLTHWGWVTHICVSKLTIIDPDNGLSPGWRHSIISTNDGILLVGLLETNFSKIWIVSFSFPFKKMHLKISSGKWRPFCLSLNVLIFFCRRAQGCIWPAVSFVGHLWMIVT